MCRRDHVSDDDAHAQAVRGELLLQVEIQGSLRKVDLVNLDTLEVSFEEAVRILHYSRNEGAHVNIPAPPLFPFDPDSYHKQGWDLLVMLLLLFTTFAVPFLLAFGEETDPTKPLNAYQIWDLILDAIFCFDILLSFCTAYASQGVYVTDLRLIAQNYLKGWFWIDVPGRYHRPPAACARWACADAAGSPLCPLPALAPCSLTYVLGGVRRRRNAPHVCAAFPSTKSSRTRRATTTWGRRSRCSNSSASSRWCAPCASSTSYRSWKRRTAPVPPAPTPTSRLGQCKQMLMLTAASRRDAFCAVRSLVC